jgi:hypothetical protein
MPELRGWKKIGGFVSHGLIYACCEDDGWQLRLGEPKDRASSQPLGQEKIPISSPKDMGIFWFLVLGVRWKRSLD